jgi:MFS family permease
MNGLQALDTWQDFMKHPTGSWLGFINAIYWLGTGLSSPLAAIVSNKYGRKTGVYIGYAFLALGVALQAASNDTVAFVLARFFLGCASVWFGISVPLLINEIAFPTHRGIVNALFNCGFYVGGILAAVSDNAPNPKFPLHPALLLISNICHL